MAILNKRELDLSNQNTDRRSAPENANSRENRLYDTAVQDFAGQGSKKVTPPVVNTTKSSSVKTPMKDSHMTSSPMSDAEQAARIKTALKGYGADFAADNSSKVKPTSAKKATPKYDKNLSDEEQSARITKALVPNTEDADRQKRINADRAYFEKRGAFKDNERMKKGGSVKAKSKSSCMKTGGMVKSSASRGDGIAQRGKTRGRIC